MHVGGMSTRIVLWSDWDDHLAAWYQVTRAVHDKQRPDRLGVTTARADRYSTYVDTHLCQHQFAATVTA